jgi:O-antigen/teichoic acid export membrane protein
MKTHRTQNATRNIIWGFAYKAIMLLLPFVARTALLKLLGEKYLGLGGLFGSILQVLNLADLGFGTAIVYSMYKPIAEDKTDEICALLSLYKKIYRIVGGGILLCGLAIMPFLRNLISGDVPSDVNIYLLYAIYLANTVLSYCMFAYKTSLLNAHQRNDLISKTNAVLLLVQYGFQLGLLFTLNNYYAYLIVLPIITVLHNILIARLAKKYFPQYICRGSVNVETKKTIKAQVSGLFISKVCGTTRNSLDNVFLSSFLGLTIVAQYGNYYYLLDAVHGLMTIIGTSLLGGIGDSIAQETEEKNYADFNKFVFLYAWIGGWCACCLLCLYQPFMMIWVGGELIFPFSMMLLFCIYFYAVASTDIKNVYIDACGLWWENRKRAILETLVNFIGNFTLGWLFGVYGIIIATLISIVFINNIMGAKILFKYYFRQHKASIYFMNHLFYFLITALVSTATYLVCNLLPVGGLLTLVVRAFICLILPNILFYLFYSRLPSFVQTKPIIVQTIRSVLRRTK